ncbi:MAG: lysylphosphatidylglycerol synthase domain-containing protein [Bacteroidota bacterium]
MLRDRLFLVVKSIVVIASIWFIISSIKKRPELLGFFSDPSSSLQSGTLLFVVLGLMILNWGLETIKWHILVSAVEPLSWRRSMYSVLSGATVSLIAPNRTGEFVGRAFHVSPGNRIKASLCTIPGSLSQLLITLLMGLFAIPFVRSPFDQFGIEIEVIVVWLVLAVVLLAIVYYYLPGLRFRLRINSMFSTLNSYLSPLFSYSKVDLGMILFLSMLRYLVFTVQFYLMFLAFGVDVPFWKAVAAIANIYLFLALIPGFAITEFTLRGSVTLYLFSALTSNATGVLAASSALWFINLVIPALLGSMAIYAVKSKSRK